MRSIWLLLCCLTCSAFRPSVKLRPATGSLLERHRLLLAKIRLAADPEETPYADETMKLIHNLQQAPSTLRAEEPDATSPVPAPPRHAPQTDLAQQRINQTIELLYKGTQERCNGNSSNNSVVLNFSKDVSELCHTAVTEDPKTLIQKMWGYFKDKSSDVATWLCNIAEGTVDETWVSKYGERVECDEAAQETLGALVQLEFGTPLERLQAMARFSLASVKFALVVAGPFVPEPFGFVARTMLNSLLSMLTEEAEQELDSLEGQIEKISRKTATQVLLREMFRVGSAHSRAADDQIKDMSMVDSLWSSSISTLESSAESGSAQALWEAMQKVTSFNRWAIIEHDLAMGMEVLRPPDTLDLEDRATFVKLLQLHFEMYVFVLERMAEVVEGYTRGAELKMELTKKARRLGALALPQLALLSTAGEPGKELGRVRVMFESQLLKNTTKQHLIKGCDLLDQDAYEFEYLVACVWLPSVPAVPLAAPVVQSSKSVPPHDMAFDFLHAIEGIELGAQAAQAHINLPQSTISCGPGHFILRATSGTAEVSTTWSTRREQRFDGLCAETEPLLTLVPNTQFTSEGLCTDVVSLFADHTMAVVLSLQFAGPAESYGKISSSTCQLAYRRSESLFHIPGALDELQVITHFMNDHTVPSSLTVYGDWAFQLENSTEATPWYSVQVLEFQGRPSFRLRSQYEIKPPEVTDVVLSIAVLRGNVIMGLQNGDVVTQCHRRLGFRTVLPRRFSLGFAVTSLVARNGYIYAGGRDHDKVVAIQVLSGRLTPLALQASAGAASELNRLTTLDLALAKEFIYVATMNGITQLTLGGFRASAGRGAKPGLPSFAGATEGFLYAVWRNNLETSHPHIQRFAISRGELSDEHIFSVNGENQRVTSVGTAVMGKFFRVKQSGLMMLDLNREELLREFRSNADLWEKIGSLVKYPDYYSGVKIWQKRVFATSGTNKPQAKKVEKEESLLKAYHHIHHDKAIHGHVDLSDGAMPF
ncbi:unnamed protein product [Effrenium voratum]|nr:unnamed protein product [Effrenium voratum]